MEECPGPVLPFCRQPESEQEQLACGSRQRRATIRERVISWVKTPSGAESFVSCLLCETLHCVICDTHACSQTRLGTPLPSVRPCLCFNGRDLVFCEALPFCETLPSLMCETLPSVLIYRKCAALSIDCTLLLSKTKYKILSFSYGQVMEECPGPVLSFCRQPESEQEQFACGSSRGEQQFGSV